VQGASCRRPAARRQSKRPREHAAQGPAASTSDKSGRRAEGSAPGCQGRWQAPAGVAPAGSPGPAGLRPHSRPLTTLHSLAPQVPQVWRPSHRPTSIACAPRGELSHTTRARAGCWGAGRRVAYAHASSHGHTAVSCWSTRGGPPRPRSHPRRAGPRCGYAGRRGSAPAHGENRGWKPPELAAPGSAHAPYPSGWPHT